MKLRKNDVLIASLFVSVPILAAGCGVGLEHDDPNLARDTPTDEASEDTIDVENGRCRIRANLLGIGAAAATTTALCTLAAPATGGVSLVCTLPAGAVAGFAAGTAALTTLAASASCENNPERIIPAGATVEVGVPVCSIQTRNELRTLIKRYCGYNMSDLRCTIPNTNKCAYTGQDAADRAKRLKLCARYRTDEMTLCYPNTPKGPDGHWGAIRRAQKFGKRCEECAKSNGPSGPNGPNGPSGPCDPYHGC
jgi:hypothetical protein